MFNSESETQLYYRYSDVYPNYSLKFIHVKRWAFICTIRKHFTILKTLVSPCTSTRKISNASTGVAILLITYLNYILTEVQSEEIRSLTVKAITSRIDRGSSETFVTGTLSFSKIPKYLTLLKHFC